MPRRRRTRRRDGAPIACATNGAALGIMLVGGSGRDDHEIDRSRATPAAVQRAGARPGGVGVEPLARVRDPARLGSRSGARSMRHRRPAAPRSRRWSTIVAGRLTPTATAAAPGRAGRPSVTAITVGEQRRSSSTHRLGQRTMPRAIAGAPTTDSRGVRPPPSARSRERAPGRRRVSGAVRAGPACPRSARPAASADRSQQAEDRRGDLDRADLIAGRRSPRDGPDTGDRGARRRVDDQRDVAVLEVGSAVLGDLLRLPV